MSSIAKEILRNYINEQSFKNPNDVLAGHLSSASTNIPIGSFTISMKIRHLI